MKNSISATYMIVNSDGEKYVQSFVEEEENGFFRTVSQLIAFDDCSNDEVVEICFKGKLVHYLGWQPGMLMEFADADGNVVWSESFPEWDH